MSGFNTLRTTILLATLTTLLIWIGRWIGGMGGMVFAFGLALLMNGAAYWFSDRIVLGMVGARAVTPAEVPELHGLIADLAQRADLPIPRVYLVETEAPNAFATGRTPAHGVVAVTSGLMHILDREELASVIAHELGHIRNRDTLISAVAATVAGAVTMTATVVHWSSLFGGVSSDNKGGGAAEVTGGLFLIILAPIAAILIQLAIARTREFGADAAGAHIARDPVALASALRKLEMWNTRMSTVANPATAHMYIVNPLHSGPLASLFNTHPPTEQRIARLERLALGQQVEDL